MLKKTNEKKLMSACLQLFSNVLNLKFTQQIKTMQVIIVAVDAGVVAEGRQARGLSQYKPQAG